MHQSDRDSQRVAHDRLRTRWRGVHSIGGLGLALLRLGSFAADELAHEAGPWVSILSQLEAELADTKQQLQRTIEQSQASNVMLEASNDELRTINAALVTVIAKEKETGRALALAQADNILKDEFLAVMSHELKHPLNLIQLNAELLARSPGVKASDSSVRAAEAIQQSVKSQVRIIEDLLDLSRVRTGKLKLNRSAVSLSTTVDCIVEVLRPTARASGVELYTDCDNAAPILIQADPVRVEQIVWNLLSNGINYTPDGGTVSVALQREGGMARLDVIDTGRGIDKAFLGHVFDMFSQAEMCPQGNKHAGLGIGLAIVHQLVNAHGGRIEAASGGAGKGARFTVWLPLLECAAARVGNAVAEQNGQLADLNILVVEDSAEVLDVFRTLLEMESANVLTASSGEEGLEAVAHARFDLIISDIGMPGMNGYRFLETLRTRFPEQCPPVVALTGYGDKQAIARATDAGFVAHLTKPVSMSAVVETLSRIVQPPR